MKKTIIVIAAVLAVAFLAFLFLFARNFYLIKTGQLIEWQGHWYTMDEIREIYPPQVYEVESKNTPEEVYTAFRQALLDNDRETALGFIREEKREAYQEAFEDEEKLKEWLEKLPPEIIKENEYGNFASYYYLNFIDDKDKMIHSIEFVKNQEGYWQIDII